jgi:3-phenylpropionate/trans-cinnamate dioxygenase ferredoxin subunit
VIQPMSGAWIDVGPVAELGGGAPFVADVDGYTVRIVRVAGTLYAFEDRCTHDNEPLDGGEIDPDDPAGLAVICPRHGARFCLRDGSALTPPAYEPVRVFAVREQGSRIEVQLS